MSSRFFENQPYTICSHFSEKASKGTFLKPEKLQNHSNKGKEKEKKKEQGEGKEEKKKSNGCTLSFYNGYFGDSFCLKITVGGKKVYLAIMLSKIQLHAYVCVYMFVCISPHLPQFQVRPSKPRLFRLQSIDSERKQRNTQNTNKV